LTCFSSKYTLSYINITITKLSVKNLYDTPIHGTGVGTGPAGVGTNPVYNPDTMVKCCVNPDTKIVAISEHWFE
jgi:hypothetical protein